MIVHLDAIAAAAAQARADAESKCLTAAIDTRRAGAGHDRAWADARLLGYQRDVAASDEVLRACRTLLALTGGPRRQEVLDRIADEARANTRSVFECGGDTRVWGRPDGG